MPPKRDEACCSLGGLQRGAMSSDDAWSSTTPGLAIPRIRRRRRRFLAISVAALAILGASLGVSFLGNTGSITTSVSAASSNFVYPVANSSSLPAGTNFVNSLKYTPSTAITSSSSSSTITTATVPNWSPTAQSAGSVTTAGDLALVDGTIASNGVNVSLYVTNLAGLQQDYSSLALPVNIYQSTCTSGSCSWTQASSVIASPPTYLTATSGFLTFNLPAGKYYDITIDTGGSYYCTSTSTSGTATLSPSYYFTAQPY